MVTLVGFATWKLFVFYRTALCHCNEPFCRQSSQQQMLWYLHALTELTWDKLRALLETHTKNSTFIHSPLTRTFGLELEAPSLYPLFSLAGQEQERKLPLARNLGVSKSVSVGNQNGKLKSQKAKENSLQTADYSWTVNVDSENIRKKNLYLASGSVT